MREIVVVIVFLAVLGIALWAINSYLPIDPKFKQLINIIAIVAVVIWLIYKFLMPLIPA
jgi:preprotein translocase subunit SecE